LRVAGLSIGDLGLWISDWKDLMGPIQVMGCGAFDFGFVIWDFGLERDGLRVADLWAWCIAQGDLKPEYLSSDI
jgi:hypothetical protein